MRDAKTPGLTLRVTALGRKTFSFCYRWRTVDGKVLHRRIKLGTWPASTGRDVERVQKEVRVSVRTRAAQLQGEVAQGHDPGARTERKPGAKTFGWAAERYIESKRRTIATSDSLDGILKKHWLPRFGDVSLNEVRRTELYDQVLDPLIAQGKHGAAQQAKKAISGLFRFAVERGWVESNPAAQLRIETKPSRKRVLEDDELAAVWIGAGRLGLPWTHAVRALLLTGSRRAEVAEARWSEVTKDRWLVVPPVRHKTNVGHRIPLVPAVWSQVDAQPRYLAGDSVFTVTAGATPVRGFARIKKLLDAAAADALGREMAAWRLHDLRHTFRTGLARLRVPHEVAELAIGHKLPGVVGLYNVYEYLPERWEAVETYAKHVAGLVDEHGGGRRAGEA